MIDVLLSTHGKSDHMDIWIIWLNKTRFLPSRSRVSTTVWIHHLDSHEKLED